MICIRCGRQTIRLMGGLCNYCVQEVHEDLNTYINTCIVR